MTDTDLTPLLARTASDDERPLGTDLDLLLARARHARGRRRRLIGAGVVASAAVLTAATIVAVTALQPAPAPAPAVVPPHRTVREQPLTDVQIRQRCLPQLAKYGALPMYAQKPGTVRWKPVHDWDYRTGDVVLLQGGAGNPVFCRLPKPGQETSPVPFRVFTPTMRAPTHLVTICAQQAEPGVDLRTAVVGNSWTEGDVTMALLVRGGKYYACATQPVTWDSGIAEVSQVAAGGQLYSAASTTGAAHKSIVRESAAYTLVAGHVERAARTLMLRWPGLKEVPYPISEGNVAAVLKVPTTGGLQPVRWRLLDASRKEIRRGSLG